MWAESSVISKEKRREKLNERRMQTNSVARGENTGKMKIRHYILLDFLSYRLANYLLPSKWLTSTAIGVLFPMGH